MPIICYQKQGEIIRAMLRMSEVKTDPSATESALISVNEVSQCSLVTLALSDRSAHLQYVSSTQYWSVSAFNQEKNISQKISRRPFYPIVRLVAIQTPPQGRWRVTRGTRHVSRHNY